MTSTVHRIPHPAPLTGETTFQILTVPSSDAVTGTEWPADEIAELGLVLQHPDGLTLDEQGRAALGARGFSVVPYGWSSVGHHHTVRVLRVTEATPAKCGPPQDVVDAMMAEQERGMTLEEIGRQAALQGSEDGPMGQWPRARLPQTPEAGAVVLHEGRHYVAVAGHRREGYRGDFGGLYARWVQIPLDAIRH